MMIWLCFSLRCLGYGIAVLYAVFSGEVALSLAYGVLLTEVLVHGIGGVSRKEEDGARKR
jgi:hypothetical protein